MFSLYESAGPLSSSFIKTYGICKEKTLKKNTLRRVGYTLKLYEVGSGHRVSDQCYSGEGNFKEIIVSVLTCHLSRRAVNITGQLVDLSERLKFKGGNVESKHVPPLTRMYPSGGTLHSGFLSTTVKSELLYKDDRQTDLAYERSFLRDLLAGGEYSARVSIAFLAMTPPSR